MTHQPWPRSSESISTASTGARTSSEEAEVAVPTRRWRPATLAATLSLLLLAACSGASGASGSPTTAAPSPPRTVSASEAATMTIAEVVRSDDRFSRLRDLAASTRTAATGEPSWLEIWDLHAEILGEDREGVTVFAPTDDAFETMDPTLLEQLDAGQLDNGARYALLGTHYVGRLLPQAEFEDGPAPVWRGEAEITGDPPTFGGHAIVQPDLQTTNGYIHVIDGVVVPDEVHGASDGD